MTLVNKVLGLIGVALLLTTLVGLVVRGRWRAWYAFTLYLVVMAGFSLVFVAYPPAYTKAGYVSQVLALFPLRPAMAFELSGRTFRAFPGARSTLRSVLLCVMAVSLVVVIAATPSATDYKTFVEEVEPRVVNGTIWIFTAIAALILWYRLPVDPMYKSIVMAYVPYLLYNTVYARALLSKSWEQQAITYVDQSIYCLLASYWAWVAWRAEVPARPRRRRSLELSRVATAGS